jgi:hypothetical protein
MEPEGTERREKRAKEGERACECILVCPSACMAVCELIKVRLHFHNITDYKIK